MRKKYFVAQEDTDIYNVFSYDDFDDDGNYLLHDNEEGYNLNDFDIVYESMNFDDCYEWIENKLGYTN